MIFLQSVQANPYPKDIQRIQNVAAALYDDDEHNHSACKYYGKNFEIAESECKSLLDKKLSLPAYDQCFKASHIFYLLDSRGVSGVAERTGYINRIRELAKGSGALWLDYLKKYF